MRGHVRAHHNVYGGMKTAATNQQHHTAMVDTQHTFLYVHTCGSATALQRSLTVALILLDTGEFQREFSPLPHVMLECQCQRKPVLCSHCTGSAATPATPLEWHSTSQLVAMCLSGPQATLPPTHAAHCCQHCCAGTSIFCGHTAHSAGNIMTRSGRNRPHLTLLLLRHRKYFSAALSMPEPRLCHTPQAQAAPGGAVTQPHRSTPACAKTVCAGASLLAVPRSSCCGSLRKSRCCMHTSSPMQRGSSKGVAECIRIPDPAYY